MKIFQYDVTSPLAGQQLSENDLCVLVEELNNISAKWNNLGLQLGVSNGALDAIKKDCNSALDCLRETLTTWLKTCPSPTWSNMVDALRSKTVGEMNLAADLEQKYCSAQDTSIVAIHYCTLAVPPVPLSQAHTQTTLLPQYTIPPTQPSPFVSSVTPPSHPPPCSAPYYYSPHTSYPLPPPFLLTPLTPPGIASTSTVHPSYSPLPQVTTTSSRPLLPSVLELPTTSQFPTVSSQYPSPPSFSLTLPVTSPIPPATVPTHPPVTTHKLGMKVS